MSGQSFIEAVTFKAEGEAAVLKTVDAIHQKIMGLRGVASPATVPIRALAKAVSGGGDPFGNLRKKIDAAGNSLRRLGYLSRGIGQGFRQFILGPHSLGGIFSGAMKNTQEADNLSKAWSNLMRVIGDRFAPYVRAVTASIVQLTTWWKSLSLEVRQSVVHWAAATVAVGALAVALPFLLRGIGAVLNIIAMLANPFALIPLLIVAAVAAIALMTAEGETFGQKMQNMAESVIYSWFAIRGAVRVVAEEVSGLVRAVADSVGYSASALKKMLTGDFAGAAADRVKALAAQIDTVFRLSNKAANMRGDQIFDEEGKAAQKWVDRIKTAVKQVGKLGEGPGFSIKFNVGFESGEQQWERMMNAFATAGAGSMEQQQLKEGQKANATLVDILKTLLGIEAEGPVVK